MKKDTRIFADFHNADSRGRVRLTTAGTLGDLNANGIDLKNGLKLLLYDGEEFETIGTVEFSKEENIWVAKVDWNKLK